MKAVKETVRKYYKYVYESWTQPILTANTTSVPEGNIITTASSNNDGYSNIYGAMDGVKSGTNQQNIWMCKNSSTGWWQVVFPYKIRITGLTHYNSYGQNNNDRWVAGQYFTSSDKATSLGDSFITDNVNWQSKVIEGISNDGVVTDTIYFAKTDGATYSGIGELEITATKEKIVETTEDDDYDFYEDVDVYKAVKKMSPITIVGKITENDGVISGFGTENYAKIPVAFKPDTILWEFGFKVTTGSSIGQEQYFLGGNSTYSHTSFGIYDSYWYYQIASGRGDMIGDFATQPQPNTTYWLRVRSTAENIFAELSNDGTTYIESISLGQNGIPYNSQNFLLGTDITYSNKPWLGSIDLNECYIKINGQDLWNGATSSYATYKLFKGTTNGN